MGVSLLRSTESPQASPELLAVLPPMHRPVELHTAPPVHSLPPGVHSSQQTPVSQKPMEHACVAQVHWPVSSQAAPPHWALLSQLTGAVFDRAAAPAPDVTLLQLCAREPRKRHDNARAL